MVDLETLGNDPATAAIVQIGACYFEPFTGEIGRTFKTNIDLRDAVRTGSVLEARTVEWWLQQSDAARASIMAGPKLPVSDALFQFKQFIYGADKIYSHATFDFVIVQHTFQRLGFDMHRSFHRSARDIRTLMDLADIPKDEWPIRGGTHHDALDDAIYQVSYVSMAIRKLAGERDRALSRDGGLSK